MQTADVTPGSNDRHPDRKPLAARVAVLTFLLVALGVSAGSMGLLFAHGAYAAWALVAGLLG